MGFSPIFCLLTGKPWFSQAWRLGGGGISLCGGALLSKKINQDAPQRLLPFGKRGKHVVSGNFPENHLSSKVPVTVREYVIVSWKYHKQLCQKEFEGEVSWVSWVYCSGVWREFFLDFYQANINWGEMYLCRLLVVQNHGFEKEKKGATLDHFQKRIEVTIKKTSKTNTCVSILG